MTELTEEMAIVFPETAKGKGIDQHAIENASDKPTPAATATADNSTPSPTPLLKP